jgi:hypothetical protein
MKPSGNFVCSCFFLGAFLLLMPSTEGLAFEREPVQQDERAPAKKEVSNSPVIWLLSIYRNHISTVDADRCPSFPSCSSYAVDAFKKHGFFIGWIMTVDRLIHEGREETTVSPMVFSEGKWKIFDPVENNDFWWYRSIDSDMLHE